MTVVTAADLSPLLAGALGRFAQAAVQLEVAVQTAIIRLLPITDEIGRVIFASNAAARNREILADLLALPDIPISEELRSDFCAILPVVKQCQEDRNRLLHNRFVLGEGDKLVVLRSDKKGSHAHAITIDEINLWAKEVADLAAKLSWIPRPEYDLSTFVSAWPTFSIKKWPGRS
jgi:hypothetical protein